MREAFRRFSCFAVRRDNKRWTIPDLLAAWTGLGTPYEYSGARRFFQPVFEERKRISGWWRLTLAGANILLYWYGSGFRVPEHSYEFEQFPEIHVPAVLLPNNEVINERSSCQVCSSSIEK